MICETTNWLREYLANPVDRTFWFWCSLLFSGSAVCVWEKSLPFSQRSLFHAQTSQRRLAVAQIPDWAVMDAKMPMTISALGLEPPKDSLLRRFPDALEPLGALLGLRGIGGALARPAHRQIVDVEDVEVGDREASPSAGSSGTQENQGEKGDDHPWAASSAEQLWATLSSLIIFIASHCNILQHCLTLFWWGRTSWYIMIHHDNMQTLKMSDQFHTNVIHVLNWPTSPCDRFQSFPRYFMRVKMHLVEVSDSWLAVSMTRGRYWQKLASDSTDSHNFFHRVNTLVHVGSLLQKRTQHPPDG